MLNTPHDAISQFRAALSVRGILAPVEIRADGGLHRCDAEGKGGKNDAAYLLHLKPSKPHKAPYDLADKRQQPLPMH